MHVPKKKKELSYRAIHSFEKESSFKILSNDSDAQKSHPYRMDGLIRI
jgi:hypothetical protein